MYALKTSLASTFIRHLPSLASIKSSQNLSDSRKAAFCDQFEDIQGHPQRKKIAQNMIKDFNLIERLKFSGFFASFWERCKQQKQKRLLLEKAQERLDKELDLQKFLKQIRATMFATMGMLTPSQRLLAREMSHIVINEDQSSTEQEPSSYDEESKPIERKFLRKAVKKVARS